MQIVIFDLDGTLADIKHRRVHLEPSRPDWRKFDSLMGDDLPNRPIVDLYKTLLASDKYKVVIVSGRNESARRLTELWLTFNNIPFTDLYLRPDNDSRADHLIKEEILRQLQSQGDEIAFVVDDRQQVVDMWRRNGITCLQCDYGDF